MKIQASFVKDGKWWVAWSDHVPGALTNQMRSVQKPNGF